MPERVQEIPVARASDPFDLLLEISQASRDGNEPIVLHGLVLDRVGKLLGAERSVLYWRADDGRLNALAAVGVSRAYTDVVGSHYATSIGGLSGNLARPLLVADMRGDPRIAPPLSEAAAREGIRALLNLPLGHGGKLHGALTLYWDAPLSEAELPDLRVAQVIGDHLTLALVRTHALDEVADLAAERLRQLERASLSLSEALEQLLQLDRLKGDFLSAVSHELRTPLTTILGFAEFLDEGVAGPLTGDQRRFVGQIAEAAHQLTGLVDDLLDFARMEAGRFQADCRPTDGAEIVREVVAGLAAMAYGAGVTLQQEVPDDLPWVAADPVRLRQVLTNLVSNGLKFTPAGGRVSVRVAVQPDEPAVCFTVEDTGVGIAPEHHAHVFQKFFRGSNAVKASAKGTGLGLAIARQLVLAQQGSIGFTSSPGTGSRFYFSLPLASV